MLSVPWKSYPSDTIVWVPLFNIQELKNVFSYFLTLTPNDFELTEKFNNQTEFFTLIDHHI